MSPRNTFHRELEQHRSAELARAGQSLRPWFARPAVWVGVVVAVALVGSLVLRLLAAPPG